MQLLAGEEQQRALGAMWAQRLPMASVLFLEGELGAGKTTFCAGVLAHLGFHDVVSSPTYSLMHQYPTPQGMVLHLDAYRVRHAAELYAMGLEELMAQSRLCLVEWGGLLYADYPDAPILLFEHVPEQPNLRRVTQLR